MRLTRPPKYHNEKVVNQFGTFDSKHEWEVFCALRLFEKAGYVTRIERQVPYELLPKQPGERAVIYKADFVVTMADGTTEVWDAKGMRTQVYILKRKLMLFIHGVKVIEK